MVQLKFAVTYIEDYKSSWSFESMPKILAIEKHWLILGNAYKYKITFFAIFK